MYPLYLRFISPIGGVKRLGGTSVILEILLLQWLYSKYAFITITNIFYMSSKRLLVIDLSDSHLCFTVDGTCHWGLFGRWSWKCRVKG